MFGQEQTGAKPNELLIGRLSYIDIGPPFDYFDVIRVRDDGRGARVERVLLSPNGGCFVPAKADFGSGEIRQSIAELMGGIDACHISDKQIERELKRRRKGSVFSGVNITMEFQCPSGPRVIASAVMGPDLYEAHPETPQLTSWTMKLLEKLDAVLGPGAKNKPMFPVEDEKSSGAKEPTEDFVKQLETGRFDGLFTSSADLPSAIYSESKKPVRDAEVNLAQIAPAAPDTYIAPKYPPIAKAARMEGAVSFQLVTGDSCVVGDVNITDGPKMLHRAVIDSVKQWKFCKLPIGTKVSGSILFQLNCPPLVQTNVSKK